MVPTSQYPRWKFVAMQGALWVVLGATVGLASWVTHVRSRPLPAAAPVQLGSFEIRTPPGWQTVGGHGSDRIELMSSEPDTSVGHRVLSIVYQQLEAPIPPQVYLQQAGLLPKGDQRIYAGSLGGYPAVKIYTKLKVATPKGRPQTAKDLRVCVVTPSGEVLTAYLNALGEFDKTDEAIMDRFTDELKIAPTSPAPPPKRIPTPHAPPQSPEDVQGV